MKATLTSYDMLKQQCREEEEGRKEICYAVNLVKQLLLNILCYQLCYYNSIDLTVLQSPIHSFNKKCIRYLLCDRHCSRYWRQQSTKILALLEVSFQYSSAHYGLWAKSGLLSVATVLLKHSDHSFMYHIWPNFCINDRLRWLCQRLYGLQSLKYVYSIPLQKVC